MDDVGTQILDAIYDQLKRTYDLAGISFEGFVEVLPAEFREWLEF